MTPEQQEAWIVERATQLRQSDDMRLVMESIEIANRELQDNADENGDCDMDSLPIHNE